MKFLVVVFFSNDFFFKFHLVFFFILFVTDVAFTIFAHNCANSLGKVLGE